MVQRPPRDAAPPAGLLVDAAAGAVAGLLLTGLLLAANACGLRDLFAASGIAGLATLLLGTANAMTCAVGAAATGLLLRQR